MLNANKQTKLNGNGSVCCYGALGILTATCHRAKCDVLLLSAQWHACACVSCIWKRALANCLHNNEFWMVETFVWERNAFISKDKYLHANSDFPQFSRVNSLPRLDASPHFSIYFKYIQLKQRNWSVWHVNDAYVNQTQFSQNQNPYCLWRRRFCSLVRASERACVCVCVEKCRQSECACMCSHIEYVLCSYADWWPLLFSFISVFSHLSFSVALPILAARTLCLVVVSLALLLKYTCTTKN